MVYESTLIMNGLSQIAVSFISLLLSLKLQKEKSCQLHKPFYFLASAFLGIGVLNILWFLGFIQVSLWDHMIVGPLFNIFFLAILFYTVLFISGHRHLYLLLPLFIIGISTFFVFSDLAVLSDMMTGIALVSMFFYVGFIDHYLLKWFSLLGMIYGFLLICTTITTSLLGIPYLFSWWFIPTTIIFSLLYMMHQGGHICASIPSSEEHIPMIIEVLKFGFFVIALSIFLMLGTLGVHELGHSLAAKAFNCSHKTSFGIGFAMTSVSCDSANGMVWITLGGFALTALMSLILYLAGNEFAKRIAWLVLSFSLLMAINDFSKLNMPESGTVLIIITSSIMIIYGITLIVKNYESEYAQYESNVCAHATCGRQTYINRKA